MPTDYKISELPVAKLLSVDDTGIIVSNNTDYQYTLDQLLSFVTKNFPPAILGSTLSFASTMPQNNTGKNGDVVFTTTEQAFYQKINDVWIQRHKITSTTANTSATGGIIYQSGKPSVSIGNIDDTYINTSNGDFYKKATNGWVPVFTMLNGPVGGPGPKGDTGAPGLNGKTILHGATNPSNQTIGTDGDFYINTTTYTLFGPKINGDWRAGISIVDNIDEINQLAGKIGNIESLNTIDKTTLVAAVNEVVNNGGGLKQDVVIDIPFGVLNAGEKIKAGTLQDVIIQLTQKIINPDIIPVSFSLSVNQTLLEPGAKVNVGLLFTFNRGAIVQNWPGGTTLPLYGAAKEYRFYDSSNTLLNQQVGNSFTVLDYIVKAGTNTWNAEVDYETGLQQVNNRGQKVGTPISAGVSSPRKSASFNSLYRNFWGAVNTVPATAAEARLGTSIFSNTNSFTLNTGNTQTLMVIITAPGKSLASVVDQDALNAVITPEYVLQNTISVNDAGGTPVPGFKLYVKTMGIPYSTNHRHLITLS